MELPVGWWWTQIFIFAMDGKIEEYLKLGFWIRFYIRVKNHGYIKTIFTQKPTQTQGLEMRGGWGGIEQYHR